MTRIVVIFIGLLFASATGQTVDSALLRHALGVAIDQRNQAMNAQILETAKLKQKIEATEQELSVARKQLAEAQAKIKACAPAPEK